MGGNIAIYIFPSSLIHSIVGETILYAGPNPTYELECANESIQHQCKQEESRAGKLYQYNIKAFVPGNNDDIRQTLALLSQYPTLIVVLQNGNGEYSCIGNKMEGLRLLSDFDSSADPSGHNGFTIELSGKLTILPKPVQMPIIPI